MNTSDPARRSPRLGIFSLLAAVIIGILWCAYSVYGANVLMQTAGTASDQTGAVSVANSGYVVQGVTALLVIAGVVLGILSLRRKEAQRGFAIAGLVLNGLLILGFGAILLLGLLMGG